MSVSCMIFLLLSACVISTGGEFPGTIPIPAVTEPGPEASEAASSGSPETPTDGKVMFLFSRDVHGAVKVSPWKARAFSFIKETHVM